MADRDTALQNYLADRSVSNRNALIAHHHGLIHLVIRRYLRIPAELHADAFQEGIFGLCRGMERFDPTQGAFQPYAMAWIRASIQKWMEAEIRESRCAPMKRSSRYRNVESKGVDQTSRRVFGSITAEQGDDQRTFSLFDTIADTAPGPQERTAESRTRNNVREALAQFAMTSQEAAILREHVMDDVPLKVLAERFGVTRQRVHQIKAALLKRMEGSFTEGECNGTV